MFSFSSSNPTNTTLHLPPACILLPEAAALAPRASGVRVLTGSSTALVCR
jgi:hypothetical protein